MRSLPLLMAAALVAATLALPAPAQAWPPVCLGPEVHEDHPPVHVHSYGILTCGAEITVDTGGPCPEKTHYGYPITIRTSADCHTQVDIKWYDCVWNCGWETIVDTPLLTVRHYTEQDGAEPSGDDVQIPIDPCLITSAPPAPLQGVVHVEQDKNPCFDTRVTVLGALACTEPLGGSSIVEAAGRVVVSVPGCRVPGV